MASKILLILIFAASAITDPQFAYPGMIAVLNMAPPPPPPPVGIPIPMPVPVGVPIPVKETTTTCVPKKDEKKNIAWPFTNKNFTINFASYFQLPPPALTFPLPVPMPPPVVMVPLPPVLLRRRAYTNRDSSKLSSTDIDSDTSSDESERRKKGKRKKNYGIYKRYRRSNRGGVKPVLTYFSENGDVKFRRYLKKSDEKLLINENDSVQKMEVVAGEDANGKSRIMVVAETAKPVVDTRKQVRLRTSQLTLGERKHQLVFRPPADKKITNLSLTFNMEN